MSGTDPSARRPASAPASARRRVDVDPDGDVAPVPTRRTTVPTSIDIYGRWQERVAVVDAETASMWDARCWRGPGR